MAREYLEFLGYYDERPYFLTVRANPNFDRPLEFAAVAHYWEAVARLKNDWRRYAESYERDP